MRCQTDAVPPMVARHAPRDQTVCDVAADIIAQEDGLRPNAAMYNADSMQSLHRA